MERRLPIKLGLNNMRESFFFLTKNTINILYDKVASFHLFSDFPGLSHGDCASHREALPDTRRQASLSGRPDLSYGGRASHRDCRPLTGRLGLSHGSQGGRASHQSRQGLLQGGQASHREASQLTERPGL